MMAEASEFLQEVRRSLGAAEWAPQLKGVAPQHRSAHRVHTRPGPQAPRPSSNARDRVWWSLDPSELGRQESSMVAPEFPSASAHASPKPPIVAALHAASRRSQGREMSSMSPELPELLCRSVLAP